MTTEQQNTGLTYEQVINDLSDCVNKSRADKDFKILLKTFKHEHGQEVSTFFLKGLIVGKKTPLQKSQRISYLLNKHGIKTQMKTQHSRKWKFKGFTADINTYGRNKWGKVCLKDSDTARVGLAYIGGAYKSYNFLLI